MVKIVVGDLLNAAEDIIVQSAANPLHLTCLARCSSFQLCLTR